MIPSASTVSFVTGMWFVFDHAGTQIALWASTLTGKEELYVAGQKVAQARRLRFASAHPFTLDGVEYSVDLSVVSHWSCKYRCTLAREGVALESQMTQFSRSPLEAAAWAALLVAMLYLVFELDLAFWLGMGLLLAALAAFMHAMSRRAFAVVPVQLAAEPAGGP